MTLTFEQRNERARLTRELRALDAPIREERNRKRRAAQKATREAAKASKVSNKREVRQTDPGFLAYLRRQPCEAARLGGCHGRIEAAHIRYSDAAHGRNPGMGRKNHDRHANPLCRFHHQHDQHRRNERRFWRGLGKDAYETAAWHYAAYCGFQPTRPQP